MSPSVKILLKVTGSISAYKAAYLASRLIQAGYEVKTVFSKSASQFVGKMTFEGLTREKVLDSSFETGYAMAHIDLARWADLTLVYPASANTLNRLGAGDGSDLVGALFLAHDFSKPYWIAPAMNPTMLAHPATQESILKLEDFGAHVLDSGEGRMACGEEGEGRLLEPEEMFAQIEGYFKTSQPKKILITAGGTSEPIDSVRSITNLSTGETGVKLAANLSRRGHSVKLFLSQNSRFEMTGLDVVRFSSCEDLAAKVLRELSEQMYDFAIHAAAVSDFSVASVEDENGTILSQSEKIPSDRGIRLNLKRNPKIVSQMKSASLNKNLKLVSFKLTVGTDHFDSKNYSTSDLIVQNESNRIERGTDHHEGAIYAKTAPESDAFRKIHLFQSKTELFGVLERFVETDFEKKTYPTFYSASNIRHFPEVNT